MLIVIVVFYILSDSFLRGGIRTKKIKNLFHSRLDYQHTNNSCQSVIQFLSLSLYLKFLLFLGGEGIVFDFTFPQ